MTRSDKLQCHVIIEQKIADTERIIQAKSRAYAIYKTSKLLTLEKLGLK